MSDLQTKLGGGLTILQDSLQQGKQKLQTAQEVSQYKKIIQEQSELRANLLFKLGEDAYRRLRSGELQDQPLQEYILSITEIDRHLFKAQQMLEQLNQKTTAGSCSSCGSSISPADKFCGSCGQPHEPQAASTHPNQLTACPTCEEQIPAEASFCACCGNRMIL